MTTCFALSDDCTLENGATCLVPGSHKLRRHPNALEMANCADLVEPVVAPRGSIVVWDGGVWHTAGVRRNPGSRVVMHLTYSRIAMAPLEDYSVVPDEMVLGDRVREQILGRGHAGAFVGLAPDQRRSIGVCPVRSLRNVYF